jgi:AcrR family transcriptional regulator
VIVMRPRTQRERSEGTTTRLVEAAVRLFGDEGYAAVSTDDVAALAGVTKGALYHHFSDKAALFRAVFVRTQRDLVSTLSVAAGSSETTWEGLLAGVDAFLEACRVPSIRRIVIIDGPAVLGSDQVRAIEDDHVGALLGSALSRLEEEGELSGGNAAIRSSLVLGALCEAAVIIARSAEPTNATELVRPEIVAMLRGFRTGPVPTVHRSRGPS